jgi:DNA integrity scanning protein DisA with diadenylate cyclase activity
VVGGFFFFGIGGNMEEKKEKRKGEENLIPFTELTKEEQRKIASNGGKASVASRRKVKSIREALKLYLAEATTVETEEGQEKVTNAFAIAIAAAEKAKIGDVQAMTFVRDSIGEKPKDTVGITGEDGGKVNVNIKVVGGKNGDKS